MSLLLSSPTMTRSIFLNLPIADLPRSKAFFSALGFTFNPRFSNDHGACMVVSDTISVMLVTHGHFKNFTKKAICDATTTTEVLLCITCASREEVDDLAARAYAAGATPLDGAEDQGFMYSHNFQDPDGHNWDLLYMDPAENQES